jgi:hypothetical protein
MTTRASSSIAGHATPPRAEMELSYFLFVGGLSGLVSTLGHTVAWSATEFVAKRPPNDGQVGLIEALMHLVSGLGLGLIYWLSWGFAAIVDVSWWARGLGFGALCWACLAGPALAAVTVSGRLPPGVALLHASRWGSTCLIAGIACAWTWQRAV